MCAACREVPLINAEDDFIVPITAAAAGLGAGVEPVHLHEDRPFLLQFPRKDVTEESKSTHIQINCWFRMPMPLSVTLKIM